MPRRYYSKKEKKSQEDYLGIWQNGQVSWEQEKTLVAEPISRPKSADGHRPATVRIPTKLTKPIIQVVIPESPSARRPFTFMPFFHASSNEAKNITSASILPPSVISGSFGSSSHMPTTSPPTIVRAKSERSFRLITVPIDESLAFDGSLLLERSLHSRTISMNSTNSDSECDDNSLAHSSRSSMTSIGLHNEEQQARKEGRLSRNGSSSSESSFKANDDAAALRRDESSSHIKVVQGPRMSGMVGMVRTPSITSRTSSGRRKSLSSSRGQRLLANMNASEEQKVNGEETPTLDEAVQNLEDSLQSFSHDADGANAPEVVETLNVELIVETSISETSMSPASELVLSISSGTPPVLPRKSSRRARLSFPPQLEPVEVATAPPTPETPIPNRASAPAAMFASQDTFTASMAAARLEQRRQELQDRKREKHESQTRLRRMSSVRSVLSLVREEDEIQSVEMNAAEMVVYQILSSLDSMDDLLNAALITRGFHQVFKEHELELMCNALHRQCPPAWEYRESCLGGEEDEENSAIPVAEYTPETYFRGYKSDVAIVAPLTQLIVQQCPENLTSDTLNALIRGDSARTDAALFRIWTFCHIFGSNKGREDDIVAQMDWLRGGILAHQDSCTSTISNHDSFYISNVLLSAPEHFAQGNAGGLSAEELYDVLEMWTCLTKLTSGITGKTEQARQFGIFDEADITGGDVDGEEAMLEEWQAYILTLGLAPVLDIVSALASGGSHNAFAVAQYNGLTHWDAPLVGSSRGAFLHEAVSRLYEERICEIFSPEQMQTREMRSLRKNRDTEFRQRRLSARSTQFPDRTSLNREWGSFRSAEGPSRPTSSRSSVSSLAGFSRSSSVSTLPAAPYFQQRQPQLPSSNRRSYYPTNESIAEEHLPAYDRTAVSQRDLENMHPLQRALLVQDDDAGTNSVERAIHQIHEMGFTIDEAKGALKITDMGDGLRVDRAVEYLMRSKGYA